MQSIIIGTQVIWIITFTFINPLVFSPFFFFFFLSAQNTHWMMVVCPIL